MKNFIAAEKAKSLREINLCDQASWKKRPPGSHRIWKKSQKGKGWRRGFLQFCAWSGVNPEPVSKPRIHRTDPKKITKASRSELPYKPLPKFKTNSQEAHAPGWTKKNRKSLKTTGIANTTFRKKIRTCGPIVTKK